MMPKRYLMVAVAAAAAASIHASRYRVTAVATALPKSPRALLSALVAFILLLNWKSWPLVWHIRIFKPFMVRSKSKKAAAASSGASLLFQPVITSSRSGLYECDYNIHKSNSTYFSDMDVSRSHLFATLFPQGVEHLKKNPGMIFAPDGKPAEGSWGIILGAVACSFKKEIKPYEPYEMWTRVLTWDRKWLYIITHFVKKGAVKPAAYSLQGSIASSWCSGKETSNGSATQNGDAGQHQHGIAVLREPHEAIFASAISKYVTKMGRLTVHPEVVMEASNMLPSKPGGWNTMSGVPSQENGEIDLNSDANGSAIAVNTKLDHTDWRDIERERLRGMHIVEHFAALDGLHHEFTGENRPALGDYSELF